MGHLGLTPQSLNALGGYKVQGKQLEQAEELLEDARALDRVASGIDHAAAQDVARELRPAQHEQQD